MALQFGPQLLLLPLTRLCRRSLRPAQAPDRHAGRHGRARPRRWASSPSPGWSSCGTSMCSRSCSAASAAFDAPARQTFVSELVGEADLSNAVALNSTSFNAARMIGPAVAGLLIAARGHRLGLPDQRRVVRRRALLADVPARRRASSAADGPTRAPGGFVDGLPLCLEAPRPQGDPAHAVPDRHVRAELPDLHLDHGGHASSTPARANTGC